MYAIKVKKDETNSFGDLERVIALVDLETGNEIDSLGYLYHEGHHVDLFETIADFEKAMKHYKNSC